MYHNINVLHNKYSLMEKDNKLLILTRMVLKSDRRELDFEL